MARSRTATKLPLDRWARILGIDPRHFNQVTTPAKVATTCSTVWKQMAWQENGQVGRDDLAEAIDMAERIIEDYIGYTLVPTWVVDERISVTPAAIPEVINIGQLNSRQFRQTAKGRLGHFISGGIEGKTLIQADAPVTYTDEDGDDYPETATILVTTTVTDPQEIALYFPGEDGHSDWEIRPLENPLTRRRSVSISGGVATIVLARELLVDPDLHMALDPGPVAGNEDMMFEATVDVYRHFNDPSQQVTLMWAPRGGDACVCTTGTCPVCAHTVQAGCLLGRDYRNSIFSFTPGTFVAADETFTFNSFTIGRVPDNLRVWYYAGFQDKRHDAPRLEMEDQWARAVTYLSLTLLQRPVCGCDNVRELSRVMNEDLAANIARGDTSISFQITDRVLDNPWGTKRGAVFAWNTASQMGPRRLGKAVAL